MSAFYAFEIPGVFQPHLPEYCQPETEFLLRFSSTFHSCVPTRLAFISTTLGTLSIVAWLFAQLPQIWKNYTLHSTSGLSIFFLSEWLLGDFSNLLGSIFTHQATWQVVLACYYCFVDVLLVMQWIWYEKLKHGRPLRSIWRTARRSSNGPQETSMQETIKTSAKPSEERQTDNTKAGLPRSSAPRAIFRMPSYALPPDSPSDSEEPSSLSTPPVNPRVNRIRTGVSPMPSPRTVLFVSMVLALACQASPLQSSMPLTASVLSTSVRSKSAVEIAGQLLSWLSTLSYLLSRLPQLYKNFVRRSTSGLSPTLFIAAFTGNFFYSASMLTNPCAWTDMSPHGGRGWADKTGSNAGEWRTLAAPFFFGAAGVLVMDALIGLQFLVYGEGTPAPILTDEVVIVVEERPDGAIEPRPMKWKRVDGWMRGWMPSVSVAGTPSQGGFFGRPVTPATDAERQGLLDSSSSDGGYGGTALHVA